jgi:hypothetical protein
MHPQDVEDELRLDHEELSGLRRAVFTVRRNEGPGLAESVPVHEIRGHWWADRMGEIACAMKLTQWQGEFGVPASVSTAAARRHPPDDQRQGSAYDLADQ